MGLLQSVDKSRLYNKYHSTNKLLEVYSKKGEDEKLHEVFEYLISNDLASANYNLKIILFSIFATSPSLVTSFMDDPQGYYCKGQHVEEQ